MTVVIVLWGQVTTGVKTAQWYGANASTLDYPTDSVHYLTLEHIVNDAGYLEYSLMIFSIAFRSNRAMGIIVRSEISLSFSRVFLHRHKNWF